MQSHTANGPSSVILTKTEHLRGWHAALLLARGPDLRGPLPNSQGRWTTETGALKRGAASSCNYRGRGAGTEDGDCDGPAPRGVWRASGGRVRRAGRRGPDPLKAQTSTGHGLNVSAQERFRAYPPLIISTRFLKNLVNEAFVEILTLK